MIPASATEPGTTALSDGEVHVWWADPVEVGPPASSEARALLSADELARLGRFRVDSARLPFLASRVLLRTVLSRYAATSPADWRFRTDEHGRPHVAGDTRARLGFSLSHTTGLVACAVARHDEVGVDVEEVRPRTELMDIAERFFASREIADLRALPPDGRLTRFYDYWTLKESYLKARGLGLRIPLDRVSFALADERDPTVQIDPGTDSDGRSWQFMQHRPTAEHLLALCIRRRGGVDAIVRVRRAPLR